MNTQELRIGNWINFIPENSDFVVSEINSFNCEKINGLEMINLNPIPLTEEWLLKFGWVWNEDSKTYEKYPNGDARMHLHNSEFGYVMFNFVLKAVIRKGIYYVHQLQNLYFALTGEELTIKQTESI